MDTFMLAKETAPNSYTILCEILAISMEQAQNDFYTLGWFNVTNAVVLHFNLDDFVAKENYNYNVKYKTT